MPGDQLTLDLVSNDQASPGISRVADQTSRLSAEMQALIKATKRLDAVVRAQAGVTATAAREEAKLANSRAALTRATANEAAAERRLATERARAARQAREAAGSSDQTAKILNNLTGGLSGAVSQYGALAPAAGAAAAGVMAFGAAVDVSAAALRIQAQLLTTAVTQALAFEQEIQRVTAVVGGGAGAFEQLRAAALAGGASTLFTAQQAAEALRFLAQAGLSADQASRALPGSLQLAAAGSLDLAKAADIATNVLSGFQLSVDQLNRVNDVLVLGANKSNTNVQELGIAFSYAAGVANSTKNEFEDVAALFQVLANNGIKASRAGTAVATGISRIQKPTPEAARALQALGISLTDAEGQVKPLVQVLRELERQGASTRDIITIFGQVAGTKLLTVLNSGTAAVDRYAQANRRAAGAAAEFQRVLQDTAQAQAQIFKSTIETLSITIGSEFLPNVKGVSQALTEQANITLNNTQLLREFADVSDASAQTLANLLRISADLVPPLVRLGGTVLVVGENLDKAAAAAGFFARGAAFVTGPIVAFTSSLELASGALGLFSDTQDASNQLAEETRARLLGAADAIEGVNTVSVRGKKFLLEAATAARRFGIETGLIEPPPKLATLDQLLTQLTAGYNQASDAAARFLKITGADNGAAAQEEVSPELAAKREIAQIEAQLAGTADARRRAELAYQRELIELSQQTLDDEVRRFKELEAANKLERDLLAAEEAGRKKATRSRKEDITGRLVELGFAQRLLVTEDQRARVQLTYEQTIARINASQDREALKAAQRTSAQLERGRQLLDLERQRAAELRGLELSIAEQGVALGQVTRLQLISLERQSALAALASETGLDPVVRAERERLILLQEQVKTADALRELRGVEAAREASFTQLQIERLGERRDEAAQIARIELESAERRRQIAQQEQDTITRNNLLTTERLRTEAQIAAVRTQAALAQTEAARTGVRQGVGTDTSALQGLFAAEAAADLERKVSALEIAKQAAELRGQDTEFLERRIAALREEAEAERAVAEALVARIEATGQLAAGVTDLSTRLADVARVGFDSAEGYEAMGAAIGAAAGLGGALAQGLGVSAKTAAKIQAAFNAAAAIGSFAAYAASGFTAANFLTSSIQYGIAAAKFGVIAGVSSGAGSARSGGGGGAGVSGATAPSFNAAAERDKTAQAFARALRAELEKPTQTIINIDQSRATLLERAPAVQRDIQRAVIGAGRSVYQSGRSA